MSKRITQFAGISALGFAAVACSGGGTEPGTQPDAPLGIPQNPNGTPLSAGEPSTAAGEPQGPGTVADPSNNGTDTSNSNVGGGDTSEQVPNSGGQELTGGAMGEVSPVMPGGGTEVAGPIPIVPLAGGLVAESTIQVQGTFYTFSDEAPVGGTEISPEDFSASLGGAQGAICTSGTAALVPDDNSYGTHWGGGIGLNLNDQGVGATPWPRGNISGFSFDVTGAVIPPELRFKVTFFDGTGGVEEGHCVAASAGANSFTFDQVVNECYPGGAGAPGVPVAVDLAAIQWQVATNTASATPFDFCIDNLTALTTP